MELHITTRPFEGHSAVTRYQFNRTAETLLSIGGEEFLFPVGTRDLELIPRLCGDWYAEIKTTSKFVAAVAGTPVDAVKLALKKAA